MEDINEETSNMAEDFNCNLGTRKPMQAIVSRCNKINQNETDDCGAKSKSLNCDEESNVKSEVHSL